MDNKLGVKKIGVVIQGPFITYGQGPNNKPEGFNSVETILKNINNIKNSGFKYVLSTWLPQNDSEKIILDNLLKDGINISCNKVPNVSD